MNLLPLLQSAFLLAILLFSLNSYAQTNVVTRQLGRVGNTDYESVVLERDILNQPEWQENADSPPLAPRLAMNKAEDYAAGHYNSVLQRVGPWRTLRINLLPVGKDWIYVLEMIPEQNYGAIVVPMRLIVLQDGKIIEPHPVKGLHATPFSPFR